MLGASKTDQATSGDGAGTGIAPGSEGKNPRTIHTGGWRLIIAGAYSPAGYRPLIPVSGVPRLAAEAYRLTNLSPTLSSLSTSISISIFKAVGRFPRFPYHDHQASPPIQG
jgi:hypothetical protein